MSVSLRFPPSVVRLSSPCAIVPPDLQDVSRTSSDQP